MNDRWDKDLKPLPEGQEFQIRLLGVSQLLKPLWQFHGNARPDEGRYAAWLLERHVFQPDRMD